MMEWKVVDTLISPSTGVSFSCICNIKNLTLTLWYQADIFLPPGSVIEPSDRGVLINKKLHPITVYNVTRFNRHLWQTLNDNNHCPGNAEIKPDYCDYPQQCMVAACPFGLSKKNF
nr:anti-adapter protein IraM [Intestinirhabdus alba]